MDSKKLQQRTLIKYFTSLNYTSHQILERLREYLGTECPPLSTISWWVREFKRRRTTVEDNERVGRPISASDEQNIQKINEIVLSDRRIKVEQIALELKMSTGIVHKILTEHLGMRKISARWVPKLLSVSEKAKRVQFCQENLDFMEGENKFLSTVVTGDETWCYYYDPETKVQSKQWKRSGSPPPVKGKRGKSAGKVMATVFWDTKGILLLEFMPPKTTITGTTYSQTLKNLKQQIPNLRPRTKTRKWRLLHDNASSHTSRVARAAVMECGFEELFHPPYSPDLAPSDYYLFRNLKNHLKGTQFSDDSEVKAAVKVYFDSLPKIFF